MLHFYIRKRNFSIRFHRISLREKCPTTEFFLVRIFLYSDWIRRFTEYGDLPNTGKYGPEKTSYLGTSHAVLMTAPSLPLREKCPNTEFFLVRTFQHSDWIRNYLSVFSPNAGKYGPEKTPYLDTFHAVYTTEIT